MTDKSEPRDVDETFRFIADLTYDWEYWIGPDGEFRYVSPACERITGYTPDEFIADPGLLMRVVHPEDRPLATLHEQSEESRAARRLEYRIVTRDGTERWIDHACQPVYGRDGSWLGYRASNRDVTEAKRIQIERDRQIEREQALFAYSSAVMAEDTVEGLLQCLADAARDVTDARIGSAGHGYLDGAVQVTATSRASDVVARREGEVECGELAALYLDRFPEPPTARLTDEELRAHPTRWVPEGQSELRGLLGARLVGYRGETTGSVVASDKKGGAEFTAEDEAILGQLAAVGSLALQQIEGRRTLEGEAASLEGAHEELAATTEALGRQNEELRRTEQALRCSEERYRQLFDGMAEGFAVHEVIYDAGGKPADYRFLEVNRAFEQLTGLNNEELIGKTVLEVLPGTEPFWLDTYSNVVRTGKPVRFEQYSGALDRYYAVSAYRAGEDQFACLFLNVSERVETERALRENEEKLRALFEILPVGVSILDSERNIRYMNPALTHTLDLPPKGARQGQHTKREYRRRDGSTMPGDEFPSVRAVREQRMIRNVEIGVVKEDGTLVWTSVSAAPLPFDDWRVILVTADVTEQVTAQQEIEERVVERTIELQRANENLQRAKEELREQNEELVAAQRRAEEEWHRYQELFHSAPDGYLVTTRAGRIVEANRAAGDILGVPAHQLRGKQLGEFVVPTKDATLEVVIEQLRRGKGRSALHREMRLKRHGGEIVHAAVSATVSHAAGGEIEGVRWLVRDVTREKEMQAALAHAEKLTIVGQTAASFAHEIKNPLSAAIGCVDMVGEALEEGEDPSDLLEVISHSLDRAARVVSQLQEIHHRSEPEEKQPEDLNQLVESVLLLAEKRARSAGVDVSWEPAEGLPRVMVMLDGMQQVFLNLVLNAIEAMPAGGHLDVRIERAESAARIGIHFVDDGPGVPPTIRGQLFEPFQTTKRQGSGLGLFISQSIVQQHGGSIEVASEEGAGTRFTVWLPLQA